MNAQCVHKYVDNQSGNKPKDHKEPSWGRKGKRNDK